MVNETESEELKTKHEEDQRYGAMQRRRIDPPARARRPKKTDESLGTQFEIRRRSAKFNMAEYLKFYRPHYRTGAASTSSVVDRRSLSQAIHESSSVDPHAASFAAAHEDLEHDLRSLYSLLEEIQSSEWCYWKFPFIPKCLLYCCCFAFAQDMAKKAEDKSKTILAAIDLDIAFLKNEELRLGAVSTVSRPGGGAGTPRTDRLSLAHEATIATLKDQRSNTLTILSRTHLFRTVLVVGLGISTVWTTYRAIRYGTIIWCKHSLAALIKRVENDEVSRKDKKALDGLKWSFLWWINVML
ncbi:hypothetical protein BDZ45DRAFT_744677 [Acephala macrosclerotiorum]|nr:hypothetical protein BDZ45DRAFT_744677 [Acephala macrosclerotiorum]